MLPASSTSSVGLIQHPQGVIRVCEVHSGCGCDNLRAESLLLPLLFCLLACLPFGFQIGLDAFKLGHLNVCAPQHLPPPVAVSCDKRRFLADCLQFFRQRQHRRGLLSPAAPGRHVWSFGRLACSSSAICAFISWINLRLKYTTRRRACQWIVSRETIKAAYRTPAQFPAIRRRLGAAHRTVYLVDLSFRRSGLLFTSPAFHARNMAGPIGGAARFTSSPVEPIRRSSPAGVSGRPRSPSASQTTKYRHHRTATVVVIVQHLVRRMHRAVLGDARRHARCDLSPSLCAKSSPRRCRGWRRSWPGSPTAIRPQHRRAPCAAPVNACPISLRMILATTCGFCPGRSLQQRLLDPRRPPPRPTG